MTRGGGVYVYSVLMELEKSVSEDEEQQREELEALASIYSQEITILNEGKEFLVCALTATP